MITLLIISQPKSICSLLSWAKPGMQSLTCSVSANPIMMELLGLWYPPSFPKLQSFLLLLPFFSFIYLFYFICREVDYLPSLVLPCNWFPQLLITDMAIANTSQPPSLVAIQSIMLISPFSMLLSCSMGLYNCRLSVSLQPKPETNYMNIA